MLSISLHAFVLSSAKCIYMHSSYVVHFTAFVNASQGDFKDISNEELASMGRAALAHNSTDELLEAVPVFYRRMIHTYFDGTPEEVAGVATWAASLKPGSWLGDTIRSRKVATVLGNGSCRTLFVHAGLDMTTLTVRL
jgi:hypothetical protein